MLLDLLRTDNYVSYNKHLAHIIGLERAIYVNQIINIMGKAIKKNKIVNDGFIKLDRDYIFEQTTFDVDKQLSLEENLIGIEVLIRDKDNPNLVKIDTQLLANITTNEDVSINMDISKIVNKKTKSTKETKNVVIAENLSRYVNTGNLKLDLALKDWILACLNKYGNINQQLIKLFQDDLFKLSNGRIDVALKLVEIATAYSYRECKWALEKYLNNNIDKEFNAMSQSSSNNLSVKTY